MKKAGKYEEKQYWLVTIHCLWFAWTKLSSPSLEKHVPEWNLLMRCLGMPVTKIMLSSF